MGKYVVEYIAPVEGGCSANSAHWPRLGGVVGIALMTVPRRYTPIQLASAKQVRYQSSLYFG